MAGVPGYNNDSDYILITPPAVEITDEHVKGTLAVSNDDGTGTLEFFYKLAPE
jgi:hypothetical protein